MLVGYDEYDGIWTRLADFTFFPNNRFASCIANNEAVISNPCFEEFKLLIRLFHFRVMH